MVKIIFWFLINYVSDKIYQKKLLKNLKIIFYLKNIENILILSWIILFILIYFYNIIVENNDSTLNIYEYKFFNLSLYCVPKIMIQQLIE